MRIAIIGPFDIENYGDHVLKEVLEQQLSVTFTTSFDIFSVYNAPVGFKNDGSVVFAIDELEERHIAKPYDALVIAGGSVIHYEVLLQTLHNEKVVYPMWKLWTTASRVSSKYGVRLIWNSPEAPLDFNGWETLLTEHFLKPIDYLSVRNISSAKALAPYLKSSPSVTPDSAWAMRGLYPESLLRDVLPDEARGVERLVVFHCNQRLPIDQFSKVIDLLRNIQTKGFRVLLLPLAYTNTEEDTLKLLNEKSNHSFLYIDRILTLPESISIFSQCTLYIGLSFHGAITTCVFGGEIIAFDYEKRRKTKELYELVEKGDNYTTALDDLERVVKRTLEQPIKKSDRLPVAITKLQDDLTQHFDRLRASLRAKHKLSPVDIDEFYHIAEYEIDKRFTNANDLQTLSDAYQECYDAYQALLKQAP